MALDYRNLDDRTREFMISEIDLDVVNQDMYISPRLTTVGKEDWPNLIRTAAQSHSDGWLADQLTGTGRIADTEKRKKKDGSYSEVQVPHTAPETLSEGEFNRYYARGLCLRAIDDGIDRVIVYRAKAVENPRSSSEAKIGSEYDPEAILADLRTAIGVEPALGIPPGPNSGLTLKLP